MSARDTATRSRESLARLREAGGARKTIRLTPAAVAALARLLTRHPGATQDTLICQALERLAEASGAAGEV